MEQGSSTALPGLMKDANLVLVGFMGAGKTEAGRRAAVRLRRPFVDMDALIEARAGRSIADLFAREGEAYFRGLERDLVKELSRQSGLVIAAGGGVVLNPDNLRDLERRGIVVCLTASPEAILRRVAKQSHRPLLENGEKEQRIRALLEQRRPLYEGIARRIDTTGLTPDGVADRLVALLAGAP